MKKILIIGQAPPAVKQIIPYDTTLLYVMLEWINISKNEAQNLFEFDALVDRFPGFDPNGGHLKPKIEDVAKYYESSLKHKIDAAEKIILLGAAARDFIKPDLLNYGIKDKYLYLPHPSKRNYNLIMDKRVCITDLLREFIKTSLAPL